MIFGFFGLAILGAMIGTDSSSDVTSRTTSARLPESQTPNAEGDSDSSSDNTSRTTSAPLPESQTLYAEGDSVHVGYTTYSVWGSWWSTTLSDNQFINEAPNAMYLFVDLTVRNDDKKARMVPPFTLVDENDAEYESSSRGSMADGALGILESLNPSVDKRGLLIFDVPTNHRYQMELSGGYWSTEDAYVELAPR